MKKRFMKNLIIAVLALPVVATATPLTIINNTNHDSTSIINGGACSNSLGPAGVTKAHSTNLVLDIVIKHICRFTPKNCRADIYMTNNCTGPVVGTAVLDINAGIQSVSSIAPYKIEKTSPFVIVMNGN